MLIVMFSFMAVRKGRFILNIYFTVSAFFSGHELFARSVNNSGKTEAGIQLNCNCQIPAGEDKKKAILELDKIIKNGLKPPYYERYGISEFFENFLEDGIEQENDKQAAIVKSLNQHLATVPDSLILKMIEMDMKNGGNGSEIKLVISQLLSAVGNDVPAIRNLAERYKLKVNVNTHVDDNGAQLGQLKTISLESDKFLFSGTKGAVTYARCNVDNRIMDLGSKATCAFTNKMTGNIKVKIADGVFTGGNFSTSEFNTPEGGFFMQYEF